MSDTIRIAAGFRGEKLAFYLQIIGISEETKLRQKAVGIKDDEREEKMFEIAVSALTQYQAKPTERITVGDNKKEIKTEVDLSEFFKERTPIKTRLAQYVYVAFLAELQPDIDFF